MRLRDGSIFSFIENDRSQDLISGEKFKDKKIVKLTVWGRKFKKAHYIDVDRYKLCVENEKGKIECEEYVFCTTKGRMSRLKEGGSEITYKGKTYWFCCKSCRDKFNKEPDKYVK